MFSKNNQETKEVEMQVFSNSVEIEKKEIQKKFIQNNNTYIHHSNSNFHQKKNLAHKKYNKYLYNSNFNNSMNSVQNNLLLDYNVIHQNSNSNNEYSNKNYQDSKNNSLDSMYYSRSWPFASNNNLLYRNDKSDKKNKNNNNYSQINNTNNHPYNQYNNYNQTTNENSHKNSNYYYTLGTPMDIYESNWNSTNEYKKKKKSVENVCVSNGSPSDNFIRSNKTLTLSDNILMMEKKSYCINCGKYGHLFKKCMYPILSFGLIGYYYEPSDMSCDENDINFIMIQSKNTFHFLDFIRGKYELLDTESIKKLFENMTKSEIEMLSCKDFDMIWKETYHDIYTLNEIQENQKKLSKTKFDMLVEGYTIQNIFYDLTYFLETNKHSKIEISWSFPKGRRNYKESDLMCAIREFEEETGLKRKFFEIKEPKKIYCETYIGDNNIEYQHRYFLAEFHQKIDIEFSEMNSHQMIEIGSLKWLKKDEAIKNINPFYKQRIEIVSQFINDILENKKKVNHRKPFHKNNQTKNIPHFNISGNKTSMTCNLDKMDKTPTNDIDVTKTSSIHNPNKFLVDNNEEYILLES